MNPPARMVVTVVCTGNVARSPATAILLAAARPDLTVHSAAVGNHATAGRPMAAPMRALAARAGHTAAADGHRSRLYRDTPTPDLIIATAPVHLRRLALLAPHAPAILPLPLADPAYGGPSAYTAVWERIRALVDHLAATLPRSSQAMKGTP